MGANSANGPGDVNVGYNPGFVGSMGIGYNDIYGWQVKPDGYLGYVMEDHALKSNQQITKLSETIERLEKELLNQKILVEKREKERLIAQDKAQIYRDHLIESCKHLYQKGEIDGLFTPTSPYELNGHVGMIISLTKELIKWEERNGD